MPDLCGRILYPLPAGLSPCGKRALLWRLPPSAPGPSGLRPSHVQEALTCGAAGLYEQFLDTITLFCNLAASGRLPGDFSQMLSAARLLPFAKKTGGVRPIAVGETLRRLTSKLVVGKH